MALHARIAAAPGPTQAVQPLSIRTLLNIEMPAPELNLQALHVREQLQLGLLPLPFRNSAKQNLARHTEVRRVRF